MKEPLPNYAEAKRFVLRCLARRSYCTFELRKVLQEKEVAAADIDRLIEEMEHLGYLNDSEWLERFIDLQLQMKKGPRTIAMKLQAKGVPESFFAPFIERLTGFDAQKEQIERLLATRYKNRSLSDFKERHKVFAALARKGFSFEVIREVIS